MPDTMDIRQLAPALINARCAGLSGFGRRRLDFEPVLLIGAEILPGKITTQGWRVAPSRERREPSERP
jgi:hypothetical protein